MKKLLYTTRINGFGEISKSNTRFRACVRDSGDLAPKYGRVKVQYESKQKLISLFN